MVAKARTFRIIDRKVRWIHDTSTSVVMDPKHPVVKTVDR